MYKFKKYLLLLTAVLIVASCSSSDDLNEDDSIVPLPPVVNPKKDPKPKAMWMTTVFDQEQGLMPNKKVLTSYLQKCKDNGITFLYLDATLETGYAVDDMPSIGVKQDPRFNWNVVEHVLSVCDTLGLGVVLNVTPLAVGSSSLGYGLAFDSDRFNGKTQCKGVKLPDGTYDIRDIKEKGVSDVSYVMLDPTVPENREFAAQSCVNVVKAYMNHSSFMGLGLDYLRWNNNDNEGWFGYGPTFVANFEAEMGLKVNDPSDFIATNGGWGRYFPQWIYFRTNAITKTLKLINEKVKSFAPECELHLWASAQWSSRYSVGQNWASKSYVPGGSLYINGYENTGFAEYLDVFILGAYTEYVYIHENPLSEWTVEAFTSNYTKYIPKNHKCKVYGSLASYVYDNTKMAQSTELCLINTDGLMVFELGHVKNRNLWSGIYEGIRKSGY